MTDAPRPDDLPPEESAESDPADGPPAAQDASAPDAQPDPAVDGGDEEPAEEEHLDIEAVAAADPRSKGELLSELTTAEGKRDEYLDDLRRSHAEFENYRRRMMRDGATQREAGKAEVAEALLEVLDDLDRTLEAAAGSPDQDLAKGVDLVASKLVHSLRGVGLSRIDATEVAFDPNEHEAVQQRPADEPRDEATVVEVLRPGYRLGDKVLRAAMVVVEQ